MWISTKKTYYYLFIASFCKKKLAIVKIILFLYVVLVVSVWSKCKTNQKSSCIQMKKKKSSQNEVEWVKSAGQKKKLKIKKKKKNMKSTCYPHDILTRSTSYSTHEKNEEEATKKHILNLLNLLSSAVTSS